ncbi:MAG TPA: hypothetical protein VG994_17180, partial [Steroidobacteraceae bacterium]|nr:hypothetical protein [Steroidobacteraceae bacterium]
AWAKRHSLCFLEKLITPFCVFLGAVAVAMMKIVGMDHDAGAIHAIGKRTDAGMRHALLQERSAALRLHAPRQIRGARGGIDES